LKLNFRKRIDRNIALAFTIFAVWLILLLISPYLVEPGKLTDLSGRVFYTDNAEKFEGINPVAWAVYTSGDFNCHQQKDRSYFLNDNQMPYCARDVGIFAGLAGGALLSLILVVNMNWIWMILGLVPMGIDGMVQALTSYDSSNSVRFLTGLLAGGAVIIFICSKIAVPEEPKATSDAPSDRSQTGQD
jgi:uncharacterized membrane protein